MFKINRMPQTVDIGYVGETNFRTIQIDMAPWMDEVPGGVPLIIHIRPGEFAEDAYIAATTVNDNVLSWQIQESDLGSSAGEGMMQIWLVNPGEDNTRRGKSVMVKTIVNEAIDNSEDIPEPQEPWMEQMADLTAQTISAAEETAENAENAAASETAAAASEAAAAASETAAAESATAAAGSATAADQAKTYAQEQAIDARDYALQAEASADDAEDSATAAAGSATAAAGSATSAAGSATAAASSETAAAGSAADAADSAEDAEDAADRAEAARDAAQAAAGDFQGLSASATGLAAGATPTVNVTHSQGGLYNLAFGIPKGDKGDTGDPAPASAVTPAVDAYLEANFSNPSNPPLDRTLASANSAAPADMVGDLKNAFEDNNENILLKSNPQTTTKNGITYTFNSKSECEVSSGVGTSTGGSYCDIFSNYSRVPDWIIPGKTYKIYYKSDKVKFRIYVAYNNEYESDPLVATKEDAIVTIPSGISGIRIQLFGANASGISVNETVIYKMFLTKSDRQKEIERNMIDAVGMSEMNIPTGQLSIFEDFINKNLFTQSTLNTSDDTEIYMKRCRVAFDHGIFTMNATGADAYFGQITSSYQSDAGNKIIIGERHKHRFHSSNSEFNKNIIGYYNSSNNKIADVEVGSDYSGITPTNTAYVVVRFGKSDSESGKSYSTKISFVDEGTQCDENCIVFSNPSATGITGIEVKKYFPFTTERLYISEIGGNSTIGIAYGKSDLSDSIRVKVSEGSCYCELYENETLLQSETFTNPVSPVGKILQVQNTGRTLIIVIFTENMGQHYQVGKFDFGENFDARKEILTTTWKTFIISETMTKTRFDIAGFKRFDSAIRSGSNSVSIRFLTYEDGSFIQKGDWMYYLVEGTGESISDLFTQIVKINFKTQEVQSIGAIFQIRSDGEDAGILLGDDSIKIVYDRNDGKWKGISCGMEYNDYLEHKSYKPKLYFETKQNILDGGIIIVRNSVAAKNTNNVDVGTGKTGSFYTEDYDFYYDSVESKWVVVGNNINNGLYIYNTPDLKTAYDMVDSATPPTGVRDTGNQFVNFNGTIYITTGGTTNNLGIRDANCDYLGALTLDIPLLNTTAGPWCTLVPYLNGDKIEIYLLSFDRVDLLNGSYDHGGLYCWKAYDTTNDTSLFVNPAVEEAGDIIGTIKTNFPSGSPLDYTYYRQWGRRDFYNKSNSFGEYVLDINTDVFAAKSNILYAIGDANFVVSIRRQS